MKAVKKEQTRETFSQPNKHNFPQVKWFWEMCSCHLSSDELQVYNWKILLKEILGNN